MNHQTCRNRRCRCPAHQPVYTKTCARCHDTFTTKNAHYFLCRGCFLTNPPVVDRPAPLPLTPVQPMMVNCQWCGDRYAYTHARTHCWDCSDRITCFIYNDHSDDAHKPDFCLRATYISSILDSDTNLCKTKVVTFQLPTWMRANDFDDNGNYTGDTYIFDQVSVRDDDTDQDYVFRHAILQHRNVLSMAFP